MAEHVVPRAPQAPGALEALEAPGALEPAPVDRPHRASRDAVLDHGVLWVRGRPEQVERWARKGLQRAYVVPLEGWTTLCPTPTAAPVSRGAAQAEVSELEHGVELFAARPVPGRLRPAVGCFVIGRRAVVVAHLPGRRAIPQWLVWQPGDGLVDADPLPTGRVSALAAAAGVPGPRGIDRVARVLLEPSGTAVDLLAELVGVLRLPGAELLAGSVAVGDLRGAVAVEPEPVRLRRYDAVAREEARHRAELEEG